MKINLNYAVALMGALIIGLIIWNIYLVNSNSTLHKEKFKLEEKYQALDAFKEVIKYDRNTARDSVRILEKKIKQLTINS